MLNVHSYHTFSCADYRSGRGATRLAGDGVAISDERHLNIEGVDRAEILVFDLA